MIHSPFSYHEQESKLHQLNPTIKLVVAFIYMIVATLVFDPWTLAMLILVVFLATWLVGHIKPRILLYALIPSLALGFGYLWMNTLFPRLDDREATILLQIGPLRIAREGIESGIALMLRALCLGVCSLFFVNTTPPTRFVLSLMQQMRISPRLGYGAFAAYRLLPLLGNELTQIRAAHQLRGVGDGKGLQGKLVQGYRYTVPLLSSGIRKADRVAMAMEARAFTGERGRTYYRREKPGRADGVFVVVALLTLGLCLLLAEHLGLLRFWSGGLGF